MKGKGVICQYDVEKEPMSLRAPLPYKIKQKNSFPSSLFLAKNKGDTMKQMMKLVHFFHLDAAYGEQEQGSEQLNLLFDDNQYQPVFLAQQFIRSKLGETGADINEVPTDQLPFPAQYYENHVRSHYVEIRELVPVDDATYDFLIKHHMTYDLERVTKIE